VIRLSNAIAYVVLAMALCGCPWIEGDQAGECSDGEDNDGDSHLDCFDPGCAEDPDCQGDDDTWSPDDDDSADVPDDTSAWVEDSDPDDGQEGVFYRADITVEFNTSAVVDPALALQSAHGMVVPGEQTVHGDELVFDPHGADPDQHLSPGTTYVATVTWSTGSAQITFTTSELGTPVLDPWNDVVGRDYVRDFSRATIVEPPLGIMDPVEYFTALRVVSVASATDTIELFGAPVTGDGGDYTQDLCTPTFAFTGDMAGDWCNPHAALGPLDVTFPAFLAPNPASQMAVTVYDYTATGTFAADGDAMGGGTLDGVMDTRAMDELVDPDAGEGAACELLATLGIHCVQCPDGSGPLCLTLRVEDIPAEPAEITSTDPGTEETITGLVEVTTNQVEAWQAEGLCPGP